MPQTAMLLDNQVLIPSHEMGAFEALWATSVSSFKQLRQKLVENQTDLLSSLVKPADVQKYYKLAIAQLHQAGIQRFGVRLEGTIDYPRSLEDADHPLVLMYYQGDWDLVYQPGVAVVGTRHPSDDGIKRTRSLVKQLVENEYTIYSGLAAGIDTVAHKTAIENNGRTIAVIGTPLWKFYPKENADLQKKIAREHLVISQVPIVAYKDKSIQFTRMFFPERNITMSAFSKATIIVEAGETSGTLIQARAALKQGRQVFILNNNFENPALTWPHKLLEMGAIRANNMDDILQCLKMNY